MARNIKNRELLGEVTLMSGDKVQVYMPSTGDILDGGKSGKEPTQYIVEAATGMSYSEFRELPFPDGVAIMKKLDSAFELFMEYLESMNPKKPLH